jgi:hypothetical protein
MSTRAHPGTARDDEAVGSADDTSGPTGAAVSPAIGPLPLIYVPRSPQASITGPLGPGVLRAAHRAGTWVTRHRPRHGAAGQEGGSQTTGFPVP